MKNIILAIIFTLTTFTATAQLGLPNTSVKDTFCVLVAYYNNELISYKDTPVKYIVEDAVNIYLLQDLHKIDLVYEKGAAIYKKDLYSERYKCDIRLRGYEALCNGKIQRIMKTIPYDEAYRKYDGRSYTIENYEFLVVNWPYGLMLWQEDNGSK